MATTKFLPDFSAKHAFFSATQALPESTKKFRDYTSTTIEHQGKQAVWEYMDKPNASGKAIEVDVTTVELNSKGKPENVLISIHERPAVATTIDGKFNGKNTGITLEASSASNIKSEETSKAAAKRSFRDEVNPSEKPKLIEGSKNLNHDAGAFVSRVARFIAEIPANTKIQPNNKDFTQLGMIRLPVQTALQTLYDLADKGLNVSAQAILGVMDVLKHYELPINLINSKKSNFKKPELVWSIKDAPQEELSVIQKLGDAMMKHYKQRDLFKPAA